MAARATFRAARAVRHSLSALASTVTVAAAGIPRAAILAVAILAGATAAQSIGYTVQVVAVSDRQSALELIGALDRFPAYFVRATTGVGEVYRVRVGAFVDREAARRYAADLPPVGGIDPVPALAENIPTPLMPLQGELIAAVDPASERWELVPWREGAALRVQPRGAALEGRYLLATEAGPVSVPAWRAAPQPDGTLLRVRDLPLWPADLEPASAEARARVRASVVAQVASRLGLDEATVDAAAAPTPAGVPRLVVLERIRVDAVVRVGREGLGDLVGLADAAAGLGPDGPALWLLGGARVPAVAAPLLAGGAPPPEPAGDLRGDGWRVRPEDGWVRLVEVGETGDGASWRALAGSPRWAAGELLLALHEDELLLYAIRRR